MSTLEQRTEERDNMADRRSFSAATQYRHGSADETVRNDGEHRSKPTTFAAGSIPVPVGNSKGEFSLVTETSVPLTALAIEDVVYKGEGNSNIVIALPHERLVTRLRKSLPDEVSPDGGASRIQREVGFLGNVVSCFLGTYARIPEIVRYGATDLTKLSDALRPLRPEIRRHKEIVDTYATKFPDYTFLDPRLELDQTVFRGCSTYCVEIKPKQGYLRQTEWRFPRCPYCLHQYAKLRRKNVPARSDYCPFELFSGVEERMRAALVGLLESPQNNLKIFRDGLVVYDQESAPSDLEGVLDDWFRNATARRDGRARVDEFCNLVCAALTRPFAQEQPELLAASRPVRNFLLPANQAPTFCAEPSTSARAEKCLRSVGKNCNFDGKELPKNSVLERVRNMQRFSYVDARRIYSIYSEFASSLSDDMIYSNLTKLNTNAIVRKTQSIEEIHFQTPFKDTVAKYDGDLNGNHNARSDCILSTYTNNMSVNGGFASRTEINPNSDSQPSFYGNRSLDNQGAKDEPNDERRKPNTLITVEHLSALQNYLVFATARDCSILMTFRELHPEKASGMLVENTIKLSEQLYFLSSVRVSDLDPKSVHSIEKHRQRDIDIIDSVISMLEEDILFKNR